VTDSKLPKAVFRERLRTYLIGVGIGSVLVGFIVMERYRRAQLSRQAESALVESASPGGTPPANGSAPTGQP